MSKKRMIDTKFWTDDYVLNQLNPIDKLLYLYLITNPYTDISGVYELPIKLMSVETGIDIENIKNACLPRLEQDGKIIYRFGWIAIKNFQKHQMKNPKVEAGMKAGLEKAPKEIQEFMSNDTLLKPMDSLRKGPLNINTNYNIYNYDAKASDVSKESTDSEQPFNWEQYKKSMDDNVRLEIQLIGYFFERRGLSFSSRAEVSAAIKRHLRAAKEVAKFDKEKVFAAMDECDRWAKRSGSRWTLETCLKALTR